MKPRSINIFLLDGDPDGVKVAQIAMLTRSPEDIHSDAEPPALMADG
jgi:hypothetical protein